MPSIQSRIFRVLWGRMTGRVDRFATPQEMRAAVRRGLSWSIAPRGVALQRVDAGGVPAEWLVPTRGASDGVLLYIHGGAWTIGWNLAHRWLVGHLARATGRRALAIDYRLAPEHPFPAALEDCLAAYRWLLRQGTRPEDIIVAGDSAGGNLTLTLMLALRDNGEPLPAAGVCLSPVTDLAVEKEVAAAAVPAIQRTGRDAGLPVEWAQQQLRLYLGETDPRLPLVSPYYADLRGLPPLLIQVGADEYLAHDARRFVPRAQEAGVDVTLQVWPGMWHVFPILVGFMPEANQAVQAIAAFCREHRRGQRAP